MTCEADQETDLAGPDEGWCLTWHVLKDDWQRHGAGKSESRLSMQRQNVAPWRGHPMGLALVRLTWCSTDWNGTAPCTTLSAVDHSPPSCLDVSLVRV
jgi:hypothetical protein